MNETLIQVTFKVLFDSAAYLYAEIQRLITESYGDQITDEQFQDYMNEFKLDTVDLINAALEELKEEEGDGSVTVY